jgi:heat shock protein HslJ
MRGGRVIALVALALLAACAQGPSTGGGAPETLEGSRWKLATINGARPVADATLEFFEPGRVAGAASCNRFTGSVTISGATLAFGPFAVTRMLCEPPIMAQEEAYLAALGTGGAFTRKGDTLEFENAGRKLVFARM